MSLIMWSGHGDHINHGYETLTHKPLKHQLNCLGLKTYNLSFEKIVLVGIFFKTTKDRVKFNLTRQSTPIGSV